MHGSDSETLIFSLTSFQNLPLLQSYVCVTIAQYFNKKLIKNNNENKQIVFLNYAFRYFSARIEVNIEVCLIFLVCVMKHYAAFTF